MKQTSRTVLTINLLWSSLLQAQPLDLLKVHDRCEHLREQGIEISLGGKGRFKGGNILLVEDSTGKGHRTKNITHQIQESIFIKI